MIQAPTLNPIVSLVVTINHDSPWDTTLSLGFRVHDETLIFEIVDEQHRT